MGVVTASFAPSSTPETLFVLIYNFHHVYTGRTYCFCIQGTLHLVVLRCGLLCGMVLRHLLMH